MIILIEYEELKPNIIHFSVILQKVFTNLTSIYKEIDYETILKNHL